jgi:hypothetical protein
MSDKVSSRSQWLVTTSAEYRSFISQVFGDLEGLEVDKALKIPLSDLPNSEANTLALLHSAARQKRMGLEVRADRDFLYVWNAR